MEEEIWIELEEIKGKYISNFGNIKHDKGLRFSKRLSDGYYNVNINCKTIKLHRLIGKYFVEGYSEEKCDINHIDGNKSNNYYKNLEWVTHQENMIHSQSMNGHHIKLNEIKVREIKILLAKGIPHYEIALLYNVKRPNITMIANGNRWASVKVDVSNIKSEYIKKYKLDFPNNYGFERGDNVRYKSKTGKTEYNCKIIAIHEDERCDIILENKVRKLVHVKFISKTPTEN